MIERINPEFLKSWPVQKMTAGVVADMAKKYGTQELQKCMEETCRIISEKMNRERDQYIAGMAVAFLDATGLNIEDVMLVVKALPDRSGACYWFERKEPNASKNQQS